jgi:hypothetical protein
MLASMNFVWYNILKVHQSDRVTMMLRLFGNCLNKTGIYLHSLEITINVQSDVHEKFASLQTGRSQALKTLNQRFIIVLNILEYGTLLICMYTTVTLYSSETYLRLIITSHPRHIAVVERHRQGV